MKCPCCSNTLEEIAAGKIVLDGCVTGCGGLWFDHKELDKLDESVESIPNSVLRLLKSSSVAIDRASQRFCPKCSAAPLDRHYYDGNYHLEIDSCNNCLGVWLDPGELPAIREQNDFRNAAFKAQEDFAKKLEQSDDPSLGKKARAIFELLFK